MHLQGENERIRYVSNDNSFLNYGKIKLWQIVLCI